jgi:hypothetical protein
MLDKERNLKFNLNSLITIEELTGIKVSEMGENSDFGMVTLRAMVYAGIRHEDKEITLEEVGDCIDFDNMEDVAQAIGEAMSTVKS